MANPNEKPQANHYPPHLDLPEENGAASKANASSSSAVSWKHNDYTSYDPNQLGPNVRRGYESSTQSNVSSGTTVNNETQRQRNWGAGMAKCGCNRAGH